MSARQWPTVAGLIAAPLALLVALFVAPISLTAAYSFWTVDNSYQIDRSFHLAQYARIFSEGLYLSTLASSAWMALLTTICTLLIALPLSYVIARIVPPRWRVLLLVALIVPGWVSVLIRTYAWTLVIGQRGLLNYALTSLGLEPVELLFTKAAVIIGLVYIYLPYMLLPIYAAFERLDPSLLEAAENLGAGPYRRFFRITLPLVAPGVMAGCVITFIPSVGEYLVPNLLGGLSGTMFGNLITDAFGSFNWPLGSALSMVLLASLLIALTVLGYFVDTRRLLGGSA